MYKKWHKRSIKRCTICFMALMSLSFSVAQFSDVDNGLVGLYHQANNGQLKNKRHDSNPDQDIYRSLLKQATENQILPQHQAVEFTHKQMKESYSCNLLTFEHVQSILLRTNKYYAQQVPHILKNNIPKRDRPKDSSFDIACEVVKACQGEQDTPKADCSIDINNFYHKAFTYAQLSTPLTQINNYNNIYEDGQKNSNFDILIDMENISKILFQSPKPAPEVYNYTLPKAEKVGISNIEENTQTENESDQEGEEDNNGNNGNNSGNNQSPETQNNTISTDDEKENDISLVQIPFFNEIKNQQDLLKAKEEEEISRPKTSVGGSNNTSLFGPNHCLTGTIYTGEIDEEEIRSGYTNQLEEYYESFDGQTLINQIMQEEGEEEKNTTPTTGDNQTGSNTTPPEEENQKPPTNNLPTNEESKSIKECLTTCDNNNEAEKAQCQNSNKKAQCNYEAYFNNLLCKSECLCGINPQKKDEPSWFKNLLEYRVRYCMVPTQQPLVVNNTSVKSIEDILNEINNNLLALQQSGQLGKRVQTTEFMESGLQKTKLFDVLTFNLSVNFKPIFNTLPDLIRQKNKKNISDKNKYLVLQSNSGLKAQKSSLRTNKSYNKQLEKYEAIETNLHEIDFKDLNKINEKYQFETQSQLHDFLTNNILFRERIDTIIHNLKQISESFKQKIENGS